MGNLLIAVVLTNQRSGGVDNSEYTFTYRADLKILRCPLGLAFFGIYRIN